MENSQDRPFFARFNAFIDNGHLASLKPIEAYVWLVYLRHANEQGEAWPANDTIAGRVGHKQSRHVRAARQKLISAGFLAFIGRHPTHKTDVYRLTVPAAADCGNDAQVKDKHPAPIPGTLPQIGAPCPDLDKHPAPIPSPHPAPIRGTEGAHRRGTKKGHKGASAKQETSPTSEVVVPVNLNTPGFLAAWAEWRQHYREKTKKPMTPTAARKLLGKLEQWGEARAIAAINRSIEGNWQGVYEDKNATPTTGQREKSAADLAEEVWKPCKPSPEVLALATAPFTEEELKAIRETRSVPEEIVSGEAARRGYYIHPTLRT